MVLHLIESTGSKSFKSNVLQNILTPDRERRCVPPVPTSDLRPPTSDLSPLPVAALRLDPDTVATLHELDVRTIGQLQAIPRSTLPSRLGPDVLRRLDQAYGRLAEAITPIVADEPLVLRRDFDPPITDRRGVSLAVEQLLPRLLAKLAARNDGALRLLVRLSGPEVGDRRSEVGGRRSKRVPTSVLRSPTCDLRPTELTVATQQPTDSVDRWRELFELQLERAPLPPEVHGLRLTITAQAPLGSRQSEFFESGSLAQSVGAVPPCRPADSGELTRLLERLSNRLGDERVVRPRLLPEEQPEYAVRWEPLAAACGLAGTSNTAKPQAGRPLRLEPAPLPVAVTSIVPDGLPIRLHWESIPCGGIRKNSEVCGHPSELLRVQLPRCWGPERIETGWWRGPHVRRDYYRVETDDGRHLWLFRTPDGAWFLHGVFE
jgi:protein ImuB